MDLMERIINRWIDLLNRGERMTVDEFLNRYPYLTDRERRGVRLTLKMGRAIHGKPLHYDSPDNNAWTRANYGAPPEPGDPV